MNSSTAQRLSPRASRVSLTGLPVAALLALPTAALADSHFTVRADAHVENNSNVFYLDDGVPPPFEGGEKSRSDTYAAYGAGLNAAYTWRRQTLSLDLEAHDYNYNTYKQLDHDQYRFTGDWEWQLGRITDGSLTVNRNREMVALADLVGQPELSVQTSQNEHATLNFRVSPKWRIETGIGQSRSDSPRVGSPDLRLTENTGEAAIRYLGRAGLSTGLRGRYSSGDYDNSATTFSPGYHEYAVQWVTSYSRSKDSTLDLTLGHTSRSSPSNIDDVSTTTGQLSYSRRLTAKTSVKLDVSRDINSYITTRGASIDTRGSANVSWQATRKIAVSATYGYTHSKLPGQGFVGNDRIDHYRRTELNIQYQVTRMFQLQPYARFENRGSDLAGAGYDTNVYGLYAYLRWATD